MFLRRRDTGTATDEELARCVANGDAAALGRLWDRYAHLLFGVAMKYLKDSARAKDLVTGLFEKLPARLAAHPVERFRPWVHTVARNDCLQELRRTRTGAALPEATTDHAQEEREEAALREADLQRLEAAIAQLREPQRSCIALFHLQRQSYQRTAAQLGLTIEQVRSHLQNGRRNLRLILLHHAPPAT